MVENEFNVVTGKQTKRRISKARAIVLTGAMSGALLVGGLTGGGMVSADTGTDGTAEEATIKDGDYKVKGTPEYVSPSYNPTEPEVQLGDISKVTVNESGAVGLDTEAAQGQLDTVGEVAVDGVKGKGLIYYILEKDGDIISVHVTSNKIAGTDGSTVKITDVDEIHGRNGSADKDGFKSNLVPKDVLPKTGDEPSNGTNYGLMASFLGLMGIGIGVKNRRKNQVE